MSTGNLFDPMRAPWMRFSPRKAAPIRLMVWPTGIMPMTLAVPPRASMLKACSAVLARPMASKLCCTPPLVSSMTVATASSPPSTKSVAPIDLAKFSLPGANAGHHAAADQGGAVQRHVLADGHAGVLVDQHLLGEGRQVQVLDHRALGRGQTRLV